MRSEIIKRSFRGMLEGSVALLLKKINYINYFFI